MSCSQKNNNIRSWTRIWLGRRPLPHPPSIWPLHPAWSSTAHRVHEGDAEDVVAEEEQLLLHQASLAVCLDLLWREAEGRGEGMARRL